MQLIFLIYFWQPGGFIHCNSMLNSTKGHIHNFCCMSILFNPFGMSNRCTRRRHLQYHPARRVDVLALTSYAACRCAAVLALTSRATGRRAAQLESFILKSFTWKEECFGQVIHCKHMTYASCLRMTRLLVDALSNTCFDFYLEWK